MPHGGRSCHTPYDIPDKLMKHNLFEPPIDTQYPCDFFEILWTESWEITWSKFTVKSSYLGYLRRKCILVKFDFFFGKSNFHRAYPIYDDFIIIIIFPTKRCTDSSMEKNYLKSIFFRPKTPYIWFSTKKFSTDVFSSWNRYSVSWEILLWWWNRHI